jgi:hypothetical protein
MSLPVVIIVGGYLTAFSLVLLLALCLGRVAKEADRRDAQMRRTEARRETRHMRAR